MLHEIYFQIIYRLQCLTNKMCSFQTQGIYASTLAIFAMKPSWIYSFNLYYFTIRYIDVVLSFNNSEFDDFVDRIYAIELEIKDATYAARSALYLDLHLEIESEGTWLCEGGGTRIWSGGFR
jgi:hypothetical protein